MNRPDERKDFLNIADNCIRLFFVQEFNKKEF